ncbi:MAG: hypothetical protein RLY20_1528 [Verrucomicrobiota bacterium]|jgi:hypothetical protein
MTVEIQTKPRRSGWMRLRIWFRRCRIAVLFFLFMLVCVGGYLNQVGLPDFIKRPLLQNLHARGIDLEFSRLRLRWYRGVVADNVRLLGVQSPVLPMFTARSADVNLDFLALARFKVDVTGVTLRQGRVTWELAPTNEPSHALVISNVTASLRFLPGNDWNLDSFTADFAGAHFEANGRIGNGTALREWAIFQGRNKTPPEVSLARMRAVRDAIEQIHFTGTPVLRANLNGDALHPETFSGSVVCEGVSAGTPWGDLQNASLRSFLKAASANAPHSAEIGLVAESAVTPWGGLKNLDLHLTASRLTNDIDQLQCAATLHAARVKGAAGAADSMSLVASWLQPLTNALPDAGLVRLDLSGLVSRWGRAEAVSASARFEIATNPPPADASLGIWNALLGHRAELRCAVTNASRSNVNLDELALTANWAAPQLRLTGLRVELPVGGLAADVDLDVLTRELDFNASSDFDLHALDALLTEKSRDWIGNFTWQTPPVLELSGSLTLPAWTNRQPDWRKVQTGIVLDGAVHLTNATYRGIGMNAAATHLSYSNRVWHLPDLALTRPEGVLNVDLRSEEISHDYRIKLDGAFDPRAVAPLLDEKGQRGLGYFEMTNAPVLDAEVWGRWYERESIGARGSIAWTNFSFRGQHADVMTVSLEYTNKILQVLSPHIERGAERVTADHITFHFDENRAYLTNGYCDTDPLAVATAIGPKVVAAVERYQFLKPPVTSVRGVIPLRGERDADLHFDLAGGPFQWLRFNSDHISGHIDWANESVTLTNIVAKFYDGELRGDAWFDVHERGVSPFRFALAVTNSDLHKLMADLHSRTNQLEGTFSGKLIITNAVTTDFASWNGYGRAKLRDGLIWDTPVFGAISTVMNTFIPGIGNSRASDAGGTFTVSNSIIHTRDLQISASGMRLKYVGTVDFATRVDARVEAELMRETPIVGPLITAIAWPFSKLFEYRVTGTMAKPEMEPIHMVPKLFLAPLHPAKSVNDMLGNGNTNAIEWPDGTTTPR